MKFSDWIDFNKFTQEPKFQGSQRKQNLICIYEDHKWAFWTHNKIVTYFMNRLIIEEDAANECLAIRSLVSKGTYGETQTLFRKFVKFLIFPKIFLSTC